MRQEYYDLLKFKVEEGNYIKEDMISLIEKRRLENRITEDARDALLTLVETYHNPNYEKEVTQREINRYLYDKVDTLELAIMDLADALSALLEGGIK